MKNILRIVLMLQAPIGLGLLVVSVTHPTSPTAVGFTYGGLILQAVGLVGSFMPRRSALRSITWWTVKYINVGPSAIPTALRPHAWITTLIASALCLYVGIEAVPIPGLPLWISLFGSLQAGVLLLALTGWLIGRFVKQ